MSNTDTRESDMFRCFYCDRTTKNQNLVSVRLDSGFLSCADCTASDTGETLVSVHGWDGELLSVRAEDIDAACDICGSAEGEPCAA